MGGCTKRACKHAKCHHFSSPQPHLGTLDIIMTRIDINKHEVVDLWPLLLT